MGLLNTSGGLRLIHGSPAAVRTFIEQGFKVLVVTNQPVIARGLATEEDVQAIHLELQHQLIQHGGEPVHAFYVCPHHPRASLPQYRLPCECRKPRAGLLLRAAAEWDVDLTHSWMVGDRPSDVLAGRRAGCRTILLESGKHLEPPIESDDDLTNIRADFTCQTMDEVVAIIRAESGA